MKPEITFAESVKISWKKELQTGDPRRLIQLARGTVRYTYAHILFVVIPKALLAAGARWKEKDDKSKKPTTE